MPSGPLAIQPFTAPLHCTWRVPGSKSVTNRALILAALAEGTSVLDNVLEADDTRHMRAGLEQLGIATTAGAPGQLLVHGGRSRLRPSATPLFVGNSGTTVRFLSALCALVPGATTLIGDQHMAKRPIADLVIGLRQLGFAVACASGCPPLTVQGEASGSTGCEVSGSSGCEVSGSSGYEVSMRGDRSSQYFSALMLMAGLLGRRVHIHVEGTLVSRPYVDMTRRMVADFGGRIDADDGEGFIIQPVDNYRTRNYTIEPDASAASYPMALAAAGGHTIRIPDLTADSLQGDYAFAEVLEQMGAEVQRERTATVVSGVRPLVGIDVDMHHISDTVMTLAAIAPLCVGPTTIRNIANIRIKETDRLMATVTELRRLGQLVEHGDDWLRITPQPIQPATIECYHDHRMAMAFGILGACRPGITIGDPDCTAKTYPNFFADLAALPQQS